ncbi:MAG: hypothetical protein NY202_05425 [Mollicutes bacterium UO1]
MKERKTMNNLTILILILTILNSIINFGLLYYLVNRFCVDCQKKIE